jgi:hypothetical protein
MSHEELLQLLAESGFETGWVLNGQRLIVWEHETEPPTPLVRPHEALSVS